MGAVYSQLSITERLRIERWRHAKVPVDEMACVLGRCRSTIFRELKRNYFSDPCMPKCDGYYGAAAQLVVADRRARQRKLVKHTGLCRHVVERLKNGWTPEQIGNRMIHEKVPLRVCQETIYRYIYSKEGMNQELWWYLPTHPLLAGDVYITGKEKHVIPGAPESACRRSLTVMSASCSDLMMSRTAASLATGKEI